MQPPETNEKEKWPIPTSGSRARSWNELTRPATLSEWVQITARSCPRGTTPGVKSVRSNIWPAQKASTVPHVLPVRPARPSVTTQLSSNRCAIALPPLTRSPGIQSPTEIVAENSGSRRPSAAVRARNPGSTEDIECPWRPAPRRDRPGVHRRIDGLITRKSADLPLWHRAHDAKGRGLHTRGSTAENKPTSHVRAASRTMPRRQA